ncbi:putative NBD/HSP70 family sugar kinase [Catenuloplanes nepalensis]|uniref:NBD/HSP70 family sugar kinase n=1 Tax=Catenuloplanes nepalensis TaxID=587533 RepID=A0ABT9MUE8_9ACTN|nr:ROK family transcriptional regulator [Catenuloplanes nepalensis]MDP9794646.1 putative NBD/HSP70 family sugar kinase [Catenuloplanes nepalensis]
MDPKRTTVRDVRRANRSVLLSNLYRSGPVSRHELAQTTALSQASVSNLIGEMVAEGLVEEAGSVDSDGGRPRILLRVAPGFGHVIGADVGETRVQVELFDLAMTPLAKAEFPILVTRPAPEDVLTCLHDGLTSVITQAGVDPATVLGFGVAVSGVVDSDPAGSGAVVHAQTLGWDGVPLGAMLRGVTDIPVLVDNGAKTLGQAEMWFGAGRGARHAVVALVGSGVGAAVIADGASYRGAHSSAGEWGHTPIVYGGRPCRCGAHGCLEAYVGAESVLDRYRAANRHRSAPGADEESALAAVLAASGTKAGAQVLADTAGYLGAGLATLVNLFNPERIVLGGWAGLALGQALLPQIREATARHALRRPFEQVSIELCQLGPDAVAMGAATLPVARLIADGGARPGTPATTVRPAAARRPVPRRRR